MEMKTKVISIETIKPSSPTPKSLQKHYLSIFDQSMPPIYMPMVYLYASNPKIPNAEKSKQLKKSLSEVLSTLYPLAGRHVGNLYIDCNDGGAPFFEAEADCDLSQAMPHANPKVLNKLLPYKMDELQDFCVAVQATYFRCGGLAIGILVSHKIGDATSLNLFVNTWSTVTGNGDAGGEQLPKFDVAACFPPLQDTDAPLIDLTGIISKEELASRIFTFPAAAISLLQERYSGGGERPRRTEALSAFIWTQFISATCTRSDPNKIYSMHHTVDRRNRINPPTSKYHFGNIIANFIVKPAAEDGGVEIVQKIKKALKAVDNGYEAHRNSHEAAKHITKMIFLNFSSICGLPWYEADFGWGRPVWVGLTQFPFKNMVFFMDTKSGDGIEAFIHLTKQDMEKFEAHLDMQMLKINL